MLEQFCTSLVDALPETSFNLQVSALQSVIDRLALNFRHLRHAHLLSYSPDDIGMNESLCCKVIETGNEIARGRAGGRLRLLRLRICGSLLP